jgi:DNA-binding FrmR family transcriptional regulator
MEIHSAEHAAVVNRLKRAQGQLAGVLRMLESERQTDEVLHQLKAVSSALDRAGLALIASEWRRLIAGGEPTEDDLERLEKLFISLR